MNAIHRFYILFLSVTPFFIPKIMDELVVPMSFSVLEDNIPNNSMNWWLFSNDIHVAIFSCTIT